MILQGEIEVFLDVVGKKQGDDEILKAVVLVGPSMTIQGFPEDNVEYWTFFRTGTDFMYQGSTLDSILIRVAPDCLEPQYLPYPNTELLVKGLSSTPDRTKVLRLLGAPEKLTPEFIRYEVGGKFVVFSLDEDARVVMISVTIFAL